MSLTVVKNTNISRVLSASDAAGKAKPVVSLAGQVVPGKAMAISLVVSDAEMAAANRADVSAALSEFIKEVYAMAAENGLPVE